MRLFVLIVALVAATVAGAAQIDEATFKKMQGAYAQKTFLKALVEATKDTTDSKIGMVWQNPKLNQQQVPVVWLAPSDPEWNVVMTALKDAATRQSLDAEKQLKDMGMEPGPTPAPAAATAPSAPPTTEKK
jgi:hypothetical protein